MASNTANLALYKKNPITDGAETFNITTMLNDNWDKIDASVPTKTTATITYYVRTDGNDSNTGLSNTAGGAFKTIQRAINSVPQIVNHAVVINVAAGTYAEAVVIRGFSGIREITFNGDTVASTSRSVISFEISYNSTAVVVQGFNITTTSDHGVQAYGSTKVILGNLNIVGSAATYGGVVAEYSKVYIFQSVMSNRLTAIWSRINADVMTEVNSGTGNTNATHAQYGGKIARNSTQPTGLNLATLGGINIADSGVLNPWGDNTQNQRSSFYAQINAPQAITATTNTKVNFPLTATDNLTEVSSNGRFTAKSLGKYLFNAGIGLNGNSGNYYQMLMYVNGSLHSIMSDCYVGSTANHYLTGTAILELNTSDYCEIYLYSGTAVSTVSDGRYGYFRGCRIV